ncbi:MAG: FHA domain-containing protein [Polyangiaceae bacterium]
MAVWLRDASGIRVPLTQGSLLIGRAPSCHVVVSHPRVSRQHVLITEVAGGAQVVPLGRAPIHLRGVPIEEPTQASHGDVLEVESDRFVLETAPASESTWMLQAGSTQYPIRRAGFRIGGDKSDDLYLETWPAAGATLFPVVGAVVGEIHASVDVRGARMESGLVQMAAGTTLSAGGVTLTIVQPNDVLATADLDPLPTALHLELMPNGALLRITLEREFAVWLPHKRGDLLAALLSPPSSLKAGDWVPDDMLLPRIWGTEPSSRVLLNTLIHRTRLTLSAAGLNGPNLVERAPGGGSTRVRIARNASTRVI